jgi:hypothetical protein
MSGLDKDRLRNKTVSFRVSPQEARQLEARIKVCGMPKGQYFIQSLLHQEINIVVGKYQSDRLSLELRRLRELIEDSKNDKEDKELFTLLEDYKAIVEQLLKVTACGKVEH